MNRQLTTVTKMPLDPLNPFADAFAAPGFNAAPQRRQPSQQPPPLSDDEASSLLDHIGAAGLGGLSFIGGILNKPGRIVRGLLGGAPREALNAIPFSDALGITRPEDEVHGTDLLRGAGLSKEHDPNFFSPEGLAGFGVDVLTDPLTYLSFGGHALTKLGSAAKKAGMLPKTVAERAAGLSGEAADRLAARLGMESSDIAGHALGGHVGVGLPFGDNARTFDLSGLGGSLKRGLEALPGGSAVSRAAGAVGSAAKDFYTATVPPLFQSSVMGRTTEAGQDLARNITERMPETLAQSRMEVMPLAQQAQAAGLGDAAGSAAIRQAMETGTQAPGSVAQNASDLLAAKLAESQAAGRNVMQLNAGEIRAGEGAGDQLLHAPRYTDQTAEEAFRAGKSLTPGKEHARGTWSPHLTTQQVHEIGTADLSTMARTDMDAVQKADMVTKGSVAQVQDAIYHKYLGGKNAEQAVQDAQVALHGHMLENGGVVTDQEVVKDLTRAEAQKAALRSQAKQLAEMKLDGTMPQFNNHAIADVAKYTTAANINNMKSQELYKSLAKSAVAKGEDTVPIMEAVGKFWNPMDTVGESVTDAAGNMVGHMPSQGASINMQQALKKAGFAGELGDAHIPRVIANDIAGFAGMNTFKGTSRFAQVWDNITNLTKAYQTFTPSTVVRNAGQDVFNKIVYGMHDPSFAALDPRRYSQPIMDWMKIANGGEVAGMAEKLKSVTGFAGLSDAQAAQKVRELYSAWDVGRDAFKANAIKEGADIVGGGAVSGKGLEGLLPISSQLNPVAAYKGGLMEGSWQPRDFAKVAGVSGKTEDVIAPVKAMRAANNASDNAMRGSSFLAQLEQGNEPGQAFANMMKAHYDFGNMSEFERTVMKRAVPFYSWARQNIPAVVDEIVTNPGGKLATTIKGVERAKGEHPGLMPGYIREGVAAPIGGESEGQQRYLSHLGLGFEDLGQLFGPGGPAGMLNPLIKAPIEAATGKQMFTGRDLRDLHSRVGDLTGTPLGAGENVLMNSPLGRAVSIASTAVDPRKTIADKLVNLTTGARLQDVNVGSSRMSALRDYIQENLHGQAFRHFDELSVRPDQLPLLSPEEMGLYRLYRSLSNRNGNVQSMLAR